MFGKKNACVKHHSDVKMLDIITMPWNTRLGLKWHFCITHLCMKFNFKCSKIIKISYAQTHRLCTYKFMLRNPFLTFVDEAMRIWLAPFPLPFELLTNIDFILKRMISQDSHHKYGNSQRVTTIVRILRVMTRDNDMYYILVWTPCLMHMCVCIWRYILQNYNYKLHFQNLSIYHILHVLMGTLAAENLDVCTACDPWDSNIQLTMVKDWRWQVYPNVVQCLTLTLVDCHAQSL